MSRGNEKKDVFHTDYDRRKFLSTLQDVVTRFKWVCHAYCLMSNHFHLFIETPEANLADGMKMLNGLYTQYFNASRNRVGHLFQGRYRSIVVQHELYFIEVARYVVLNPVSAGFVKDPADWKWSSYLATTGAAQPEPCFTPEFILKAFGGKEGLARQRYIEFVHAGIGKVPVWKYIRSKMILGDEEFVRNLLKLVKGKTRVEFLQTIIKKRRPPLATIFSGDSHSNDALNQKVYRAVATYGYKQKEIAEFLGISPVRVHRIFRRQCKNGCDSPRKR